MCLGFIFPRRLVAGGCHESLVPDGHVPRSWTGSPGMVPCRLFPHAVLFIKQLRRPVAIAVTPLPGWAGTWGPRPPGSPWSPQKARALCLPARPTCERLT